MDYSKTKRMVLAAMFLALGLLLPLIVGHLFPMGWVLLPMHIPVLLCGFICGGPWGLAVGAVTPLLSSLISNMPPFLPTLVPSLNAGAVPMAFEMATYGMLAGLFYKLFPKKVGFMYVSLILAMIGGRIVWGIASYLLLQVFIGPVFTWEFFFSGAFVMVFPGIAIQIVLIPLIMIALQLTRKKPGKATEAA